MKYFHSIFGQIKCSFRASTLGFIRGQNLPNCRILELVHHAKKQLGHMYAANTHLRTACNFNLEYFKGKAESHFALPAFVCRSAMPLQKARANFGVEHMALEYIAAIRIRAKSVLLIE